MRVFLLVMVIMGSFLGAGFASGKEIVTYFSVFGGASYFGVATCVIVLFLLLLFFFWLSQKVDGLDGLIQEYFFGYGKTIKILFAVCILILVSAMFAGVESVGEVLGLNKWLVLGLTAGAVFVCNYYGIRGISGINAIIVPLMMTIMLIVMCKSMAFEKVQVDVVPILSGATYAFINMLTIGVFILEIGKNYSQKEGVWASILCSGIVGVLLFICNLGLMPTAMVGLDMPFLKLATNCGNVIYFSSILTIWLAILTTLFSNVYVLDGYFSKIIAHKSKRLAVIILLSIIISQLGFDIIVKYMYLFIGLMGAMLVLIVCLKEKKTKLE